MRFPGVGSLSRVKRLARRDRRNARGFRQRQVNRIPIRPRILIVCEGEKTEPEYFRSFRVTTSIVTVYGVGANTNALVEVAISLQKREGPFEQVWCVFDRDSFPSGHFKNAISEARRNNIQVAYSNEAFELWYVLHFDYLDAAVDRYHYVDRLSTLLGVKYQKNSATMYDTLLPRQQQAIRNAEKLLATYDPSDPEKDKPSTTVHLLAQELNRYLRFLD